MNLLLYFGAKVLGALAMLVVGAGVVFLLMHAVPGDAAMAALGDAASPDAVASFRAEHHLNDPLAQQFWDWARAALTGDLGKSISLAGGFSTSALIAGSLPNTLFVGGFALVIAIAISLVAGSIAASRHGRMEDVLATSGAIVTISMPDFWLGYMLVLVFSLGLGWFPAYGFVRPSESLAGAFHSGFLPALAIAVPMAGIFSRMLRTTLLETFRRAYVVSAHAMGFGRSFIFWHYVFRNALIPYVTAIGLQARYLLGGVVVIERVFGVPGVGSVMVDAAFARDYGVVQGCAVVFLVIVIATNLLVDALCGLLDPRRAA
ncbi:MAG: ABC transporter permease [Acetobacteraceae bacterium]|nr:ABC transporter permease [Acetobacteraceae bacterium]